MCYLKDGEPYSQMQLMLLVRRFLGYSKIYFMYVLTYDTQWTIYQEVDSQQVVLAYD